jgi:hypothetical protein
MVREPIVDNAADGADGVRIQMDPTSYAGRLDGEAAVVETVLATADGTASPSSRPSLAT